MSEETSVIVQKLLDRLREGDAAAGEELLGRIMRRLEAMVHKALQGFPGVRHREQTPDVLQNTLLRVHRSLQKQKFATSREFFGFAGMLIRRELITLLRHYHGPQGPGTHEQSPVGELSSSDHPAIPASDPARLEQWALFHESVDGFPEDVREVFALVWYHGLEQQDIAQVLGVSLKTVKRRWRQARVSLADRFGEALLE